MATKTANPNARPTGNATELAEYLGIGANNTTSLKRQGIITPNSRGLYDLKKTVSAYCTYLRENIKSKSKDAYDQELKYWKIESVKQGVREWRLTYGRRLASSLLVRIGDTLADFRDSVRDVPRVADAVSRLRDRVLATDPDAVAWDVEAEEQEDEERDAQEADA